MAHNAHSNLLGNIIILFNTSIIRSMFVCYKSVGDAVVSVKVTECN